MMQFLNSVVHVIAERVMEAGKSGGEPEEKPFPPLSSREHQSLLIRMYCVLIALSFLVGTMVVVK